MMNRESILVVDDSYPIIEFIVDSVLKPNGYKALIARDGVEALEIVRRQHPDLILLDLQMPRMDGMQVLDRLNAEHLNVPVILMTAHGSEAIAVEVFRRGVKDYIMKGDSFAADEIIAAIERSLSEVRLRKQKEALTTRLVNANADLNRRLREMRILYSIGKSVTALMDMDGLMRRVVGAATILTDSEEGAIFIIERGELICKSVKRAGDERPVPLNRAVTEPLAAQAIESGQVALSLPDAAARKNGTLRYKAALVAPLMLGSRPIGALVVKNLSPDAPVFKEHDGELLSALADYAAIAYKTQGRIHEEDRARLRDALHSKTVFVSYRRSDWDSFVRPLVEFLLQEGINVWIDQSLLEGGQDWLDKINQALDDCSALVLCVTPEALKSRYVRLEYRYFIHHEKPIIPVICRETTMPAELLGIQSLDYGENRKLIERLRLVLNKNEGVYDG
ncbi:MAG: response regulator [Chloroflexi bacterium]|nr:response regulator [Chloroflexota bacterium]